MPLEQIQNPPLETAQTPVLPPVPPPGPVASKKCRGRGATGLRAVTLCLLIFLGYKVVPFYYYYFDLKRNCGQLLKNAAVESDEELRRDLVEVAQRHGVEVTPRDIGIQRVGSRIKIWLHYQEHLDVTFKGMTFTLYTFDFTPTAERVLGE
jgi:hypothetical protein